MNQGPQAQQMINPAASEMGASSPARIGARAGRLVGLAITVVAVIVVVVIHAKVAAAGDDYIGVLAIFDRLFDLLLAAGLAGTAFLVGSAISGVLSISYRGAAEELSFSVMIGTGALGLATLGLGLARLLTPAPVCLLMAAIILVTARQGVARVGALIKATSKLRSTTQARSVIILFGIMAGVLILRSL